MDSVIENVIEQKLNDAKIYDQNERRVAKEKIEFLLKQNEQIIDTVDVRILTTGYDDLSDLLSILTVYPDAQEKIVGLGYEQYKLFSTILRNMDKNDIEWISVAEDFLENIKKGEFHELFFDSKMIKKIDELYEKNNSNKLEQKEQMELENITGILTKKNIFEINSYNDLVNVNLDMKYHDLLIGNIKDDEFSKLSKTDKLRHVILEKRFGHGLDVANEFLERYGSDYEEITKLIDNENDFEIYKYLNEKRGISEPEILNSEIQRIKKENDAVKKYLTALKTITETSDLSKLKKYYNDAKTVSSTNYAYRMDSITRKFFCRQKNKELYKIKNDDLVQISGRNVYMIEDESKLSISSLNSYANSFDWDVKLLQNHGICTSLLADNNMNHAPIKGACLGFEDYDERSLYVSSPWDLASERFVQNMNISRAKTSDTRFGKPDIKFYTPNSQINHTRRRCNEDLWERRELDTSKIDYENEKFKKQPSYVVYFSESSIYNYISCEKDILLNSDNLRKYLDQGKLFNREYRRSLVEQYSNSDYLWRESLLESDKRGKDIVIKDRTFVALKQRLKIDDLENKIMEYDINLLNSSDKYLNDFMNIMEKMIVESENNRAGYSIRDSVTGSKNEPLVHEEIREKLFSTEIMQDRLSKLESKIKLLDTDKQKKCFEKLAQITRNEIEKYNHAYFENDPGYDLNAYLKHYLGQKINMDINQLLQEKDSLSNKSGGELVCEAIGDIRELDEYESSSSAIHGQKHINNVVLFSYLIGKSEGQLDSKGIELLLQAAKFHDVGRDGKWNGLGHGNRHDFDEIPHAEPSALGAEFYMKKEKKTDGSRKYTDEEIGIVKAAICYHEVREKNHNQFNEDRFEELCEMYGITEKNKEKAKLICIYLKDADAVDRTRFMQDYEEDVNTIPEHKRYMRRFYDGLDTSYLRTDSSLLLVDDARKMHKELLKKGCDYVFNDKGNIVNDAPETQLLDVLNPYQHAIYNKPVKYKVDDKLNKIKDFLQEKENEKNRNEINDLMNICRTTEKGLLARLRNWGRNLLQKIRNIGKDIDTDKGL